MTIKQERAAQLIQEILGELLMFEVTDPRLQGLTVTDVKVDREIEYADVYVHAMDDPDEVMAGLLRATGFLRSALAARTRFRKTPALHFHWDAAIDRGERIDALLRNLEIPSDEVAAAADTESETPAEENDSDNA